MILGFLEITSKAKFSTEKEENVCEISEQRFFFSKQATRSKSITLNN